MIRSKFPNLYRKSLYTLFFVGWLSGTCFYVLSRWVTIEGDFGPERHPLQFPMLKVHGGVFFLLLFYFGFIAASHIPVTWRMKKLRWQGIALVVALLLQIITAYLLYYLSDEDWRAVIANVHAFAGFALPLVLVFHVVSAVRSRKLASQTSQQSTLKQPSASVVSS